MTIVAFGFAAIAAVAAGAVLGAATYLCVAEKSSPAEWDWQQHR